MLSDRSYTVRILEESLVYSIQALNDLELELDEKQARISESTDDEVEHLVRRIHAQIGCIDRFELTLKACMEEQESAQALHMAFQTNPGPGTPMSMRASPIMPADESTDTVADWNEHRQEEPGSPTSLIAEPTQAPMTPFDETMALLNVRLHTIWAAPFPHLMAPPCCACGCSREGLAAHRHSNITLIPTSTYISHLPRASIYSPHCSKRPSSISPRRRTTSCSSLSSPTAEWC